ncbi:hypothetical protein Tco_0115393 [Tanacetum coccineum]
MTRSTIKKLKEPLEEPEKKMHRLRRAASRQQRNESLAIAGRNLFKDEASSSANSGPKPMPPFKSLREHSSPNLASFQNPIVLLVEQTGNIIDSRDIWQIQGDNTWEEPSPMNISFISEVLKPTFKERMKKAQEQLSYLTTPVRKKTLRNPYLICDICGGAHKANECDSNKPQEQVCLSGVDIYDNPSLLRFYQNDNIPSWGNVRRRIEGEEGPEWVVKSKFEDKFANFMLEKDLMQRD